MNGPEGRRGEHRAVAALRRCTFACAALVGYVYVGYPLLVTALARTRPKYGPYPDGTPAITLIVSALDEREGIGAKLANTRALDYPPQALQVVVVTDGSTDGTDRLVQELGQDAFGEVLLLHRPERRGKAAAMRRGVDAALHPLVVFSDANNLYSPDALREVVAPFADPGVGAVTGAKHPSGGPEQVSVGERLYWSYESFINRQESRAGCCTAVVGELLAVRRDLVPEFPPGLVNDDFFIAMHVARRGYRVAYAPGAVSREPSARGLAEEAARRKRIAAGRWQLLLSRGGAVPLRRPVVLWQVVSHKYLRLVLPLAMAGALAGNAAEVAFRQRTGRASAIATAALGAQCAGYLLAAAAPLLPRSAGPLRGAALAARYLVRSNWASLEGLVHYGRSRSTLHLWERVARAPGPPAA